MKLDELKQPNKEITKSYLNLLFKAAKSGQADTKNGVPKLDAEGEPKSRAKPLSPEYGERRALRGIPTKDNHERRPNKSMGPIIGSGGPMHNPISPVAAAKELANISDKMQTGKSLPYSQLKDKSDSYEAVTMRNKRSAPGRSAVWPNGAKWDKKGPYYGMNRTVLSPDGTRKVTKKRPAAPKAASAGAQLASPGQKKIFTKRTAARRSANQLSRKSRRRQNKKFTTNFENRLYMSDTIDENFSKSLDEVLGL